MSENDSIKSYTLQNIEPKMKKEGKKITGKIKLHKDGKNRPSFVQSQSS